MELYGYEFICESDLAHHGILGQKWGIRRFQNEDGSLTEAGKRRVARQESYRRGRDISNDYYTAYDKKMEQLRNRSTVYQHHKKANNQLENLYDLDENGKSKSDSSQISDFRKLQQTYAQQSHWNHDQEMKLMDSEFREKAEKYAKKEVIAKYGDDYVKDLKHYEAVNAGITAAASIVLFASSIAISKLLSKR